MEIVIRYNKPIKVLQFPRQPGDVIKKPKVNQDYGDARRSRIVEPCPGPHVSFFFERASFRQADHDPINKTRGRGFQVVFQTAYEELQAVLAGLQGFSVFFFIFNLPLCIIRPVKMLMFGAFHSFHLPAPLFSALLLPCIFWTLSFSPRPFPCRPFPCKSFA